MKNLLITSFTLFFAIALLNTRAQVSFYRYDSIPVEEDGTLLKNPWAGGLNSSQFSEIDLNQDGQMDLFIFDRSRAAFITLLNEGVPGEVAYKHTTNFDDDFPALHDWVLLRDYNCDGKNDIFTYSSGGMAVYLNTSDESGLSFEKQTELLLSYYDFGWDPYDANIYVSLNDIPAIDDVDGDGDLDILTFTLAGSTIEYHKNLSMENHGSCDSLDFAIRNRCWGYFYESDSDNSVVLFDTCEFNVVSPESHIPNDVEKKILKKRNGQRHSGSTVLTLDMNGDGTKEMVLGDISFNNLVLLTNGGTPENASITAQDTAFPSDNVPVDLQLFPAAFYLDVNNDGIKDLIVSPNDNNISENFTSVLYYTNSGSDDQPIFSLEKNNLLQEGMIDVGSSAYPVIFDFNADGLKDLLVSNFGYFQDGGTYESMIAAYANVGTQDEPAFELVTRDYQNLSATGLLPGIHPAFGDLDNDGDEDMIVGDFEGNVHYFTNTAGAGVEADFSLTQPNYTDAEGTVIDVGQFAAPQIIDLDNDGLLDLILGERNGNFNFLKNIGTAESPSFDFVTDSLGKVDTREYWNNVGYSVPSFFKLNEEYKLLSGSESGYLFYFDQIDNNLDGTFEEVDTTFLDIYTGRRTAIAIGDITNDGRPDLFVGNIGGGVDFFKGDLFDNVTLQERNQPNIALYPNPATDRIVISCEETNHCGRLGLEVYDSTGKLVWSKSTLSKLQNTIDIGTFPRGIYLFHVHGDQFSWSQKLIKK